MDQIYRRAQRVVFWLGRLTESVDALLTMLAKLQRKTSGLTWSPTDFRWQLNWEQIQIDSPTDRSTLQMAFKQILERPWFRRVWILLEVANARAAVVHCGHKSVSARIFTACPSLLGYDLDPHCQAVFDVMPGPSRTYLWWNQERDLFTLLRRFCRTEASREHDRIFALFGLCPAVNAKISTDYNKTIPYLIRETVAFICACDINLLPGIVYGNVQELVENLDAFTLEYLSACWAIRNLTSSPQKGNQADLTEFHLRVSLTS